MDINKERLLDSIFMLGKIGIDASGERTRLAASDAEKEGRDFVVKQMREAGLDVVVDRIGNIFGIWQTEENRKEAPLMIGSHIDTVINAGQYDGCYGVLTGIEIVRTLKEQKAALKRPLVVGAFTNEEGVRYQPDMMGSLVYAGDLSLDEALDSVGTDGTILRDELTRIGYGGTVDPGFIKPYAFIELHIEQGPTLDSSETERVGIVTGIRGNVRHRNVRCIGQTAHSGAVDKQYRHDAVMATVDLLHRMDCHWDEWLEKGADLVFTVGVMQTGRTAAISVIPGEVSFTIDMRSLSMDTCEGFHDLLLQEAEAVAKKRGVKFEFDKKLITAASKVDEALSAKLVKAAGMCGVPVRRLASGAGHDTAVLSNAGVPATMIFVANQNGSHNPYEDMKIEDFMKGVAILWSTVEHYEAL